MGGWHINCALLLAVIIFKLAASNDLILPCPIPNEPNDGVCIPRSRCNSYIEIANVRPLKSDRLAFLKQLQCNENSTELFVCCPTNSSYLKPIIQLNGKKRKVRNNSTLIENEGNDAVSTRFSTAGACGIQSYANRIQGGDISELDEFPWLALLFYAIKSEPTKYEHACGGVLVTARHVITAAHCLIGEVQDIKGELQFVRLGEFNLDDNPDCIQDLDEEDCADPPLDFHVSKNVIHPMYNPRSQNHHHDIAILTLKKETPYTIYIRPICLPQGQSQTFRAFFVAGWGRTSSTSASSPYKMRVKLPFVERRTCARVYMTERLQISTGQICAGGQKGFDSCLGDSGSPLMYTNSGFRWELVGIVSLGLAACGLEGVPGVYTHVQNYLDWINANTSE